MKSLIFTAFLLLGLSVYTQAQNTKKRARIKYLFSLMKQDSLMFKQRDASLAMMRRAAAMGTEMASHLGMDSLRVPVDSARLKRQDAFITKVMKVSSDNTMKMINEDLVDIYDRYFTADEIEAFCTFYQSSVGKKLIDKTPAISQEVMTQAMTKYQPILMNLLKEFIDEERRETEKKFKN
ncbi:DUF2059 domain-containing protein [Fibrella sp. ES10-3-2-2]|nr:hypothetical protein A6C57_06830 [Fibrella sp. ES10-3-2-2]